MLKLSVHTQKRAKIVTNNMECEFKKFLRQVKTLPTAKFVTQKNGKFWTIEYQDCVKLVELFFDEGIDITDGVMSKI